ncbi:MAG: hypothetical protein Q8R79_06045 [Legionellaceae bacterium]|nr:hypothetical protein [Legionellaceae bacterium]
MKILVGKVFGLGWAGRAPLGVFPNKEDKLRLQQASLEWSRYLFLNASQSDQNKPLDCSKNMQKYHILSND